VSRLARSSGFANRCSKHWGGMPLGRSCSAQGLRRPKVMEFFTGLSRAWLRWRLVAVPIIGRARSDRLGHTVWLMAACQAFVTTEERCCRGRGHLRSAQVDDALRGGQAANGSSQCRRVSGTDLRCAKPRSDQSLRRSSSEYGCRWPTDRMPQKLVEHVEIRPAICRCARLVLHELVERLNS